MGVCSIDCPAGGEVLVRSGLLIVAACSVKSAFLSVLTRSAARRAAASIVLFREEEWLMCVRVHQKNVGRGFT